MTRVRAGAGLVGPVAAAAGACAAPTPSATDAGQMARRTLARRVRPRNELLAPTIRDATLPEGGGARSLTPSADRGGPTASSSASATARSAGMGARRPGRRRTEDI